MVMARHVRHVRVWRKDSVSMWRSDSVSMWMKERRTQGDGDRDREREVSCWRVKWSIITHHEMKGSMTPMYK